MSSRRQADFRGRPDGMSGRWIILFPFLLIFFCLSAISFAEIGDSHDGQAIIRTGAASQPAGTPLSNKPTFDIDSGQIALALSVVIGLILLLRSLLKRVFPGAIVGGRSQAVKVVARCPLGPKQQVLLLQVGRRVVVIGDSASQFNCLCQITDADEVSALLGQIRQDRTAMTGSPFTSWFTRATDAFTSEESEAAGDASAPAEPREPNSDIS